MPALSTLRERLAEACLELVSIPSVTGSEAEIVSHLERWALSIPSLTRDDVIRLGNTLTIGQWNENRPCVALVGHVDTVPPHETDGPYRCEGDRVVGVGASDMKGSIAVMQALYEFLDLRNLPFSLLLLLYDKEEGPYADNGLQSLLDHHEALREIDLAIAMEPTDNTLQLGCMGGIHARVTFLGKAAHSARPWEGDNAIHKAGPLLTRLLERAPRETEVEGLVFRDAMGVTMAQGGHIRNVIPERFTLNLNYRFAPVTPIDKTIEAATAEIMDFADGATIELVDVAPPGPVPVDNPILEHLQSHAELPVLPKQAWSDVARLAAHGIDAINFGPGSGAQAHQAGEWISVGAMVQAYEVLERTLTSPLEVPGTTL